MADLVPVRVRDCSCPGSPHAEGDFAYLKPRADVALGLAVHAAISGTAGDAIAMQVALGRMYLIYGVGRWDLQDEHGKTLPINAASVDSLDWADAYPVANAAADLYGDSVLAPLVASLSKSSPNGQTAGSTSRRKSSTASPRKQ